MKKLLTLVLLFTTLFINAQTNEEPEFPNENSNYLTFDISTVANVFTPRYRFGYIHAINEKWRIGVDVGYGQENISIKLDFDTDTDNYQLIEVRSEVYYIFNPTRRVNHYISGEIYHINHQEDLFRNYIISDNGNTDISYDSAHITREKSGINLKYGVMVPFGEKIGMNFYIGIGPKIKNISFSEVVNPSARLNNNVDEWGFLNATYRNEGTNVGVNPSLGIKFFYKL